MSFWLHDALNASVVILGVDLIPTPEAVDALRAALQTDMRITNALTPPQPSGEVEQVRSLLLDRDRVEITVQGSRSTVLGQHPDEENLSRLAEIAAIALDISGQTTGNAEAVGYNVELIFEQDSGQPAPRYLGERLFDYSTLEDEAWPLLGGAGRIVFGNSQESRMFTAESRFGEDQTTRVFVSANLQVAGVRIPDEGEVREYLQTIWGDAHRFMERLDQKGVAQ